MENSLGGFLMNIVPLQHTTITLPGTNSSPENGWFQFQYDRFMGELLVSGM